MIDIGFYMKAHALKQELMSGRKGVRQDVFEKIEECRSKDPVIYNIETTNACNMTCKMCPRTTMMTRKITNLDLETFKRIADQIGPFPESKWQKWETFVEKEYKISKNDMSENHFFLYVIPKVLVLHGYGDPLLDREMPQKIKMLNDRKIETYFSCNPANIDIDKTMKIFEAGLNYIKYSIESVDDLRHKQIRGEASNFSESYNKILKLLELKKKNNYKTIIVITMLNLNKVNQTEEYKALEKVFTGLDVYLYLKSQDQQWYENKKPETKSIHWLEFCQFPWSSMTIKSNGEAVECVEDYNNEIVLGNAKTESLSEIWNGEKYRSFRKNHFNLTRNIKCTEQCDMHLIGSLTGGNNV
jgi:radical SAM protein with 4Fe4S-binding SPASM domain